MVKRLGCYAAHLWMTGGDRLLVGGPCPGQISLLGEQVSEEDHGHRCQFGCDEAITCSATNLARAGP